MTVRRTYLPAVVALALLLAGCGAGPQAAHAGSGAAPIQVVDVTADPSGDHDFVPRSYTARAGRTTIELYNPFSTFGPQRIAIRRHGVHAAGEVARRGGVSRATVALRPGRYQLYSPVGSDAQDGMTAPLTVVGRQAP
jgi:hypothetical protein